MYVRLQLLVIVLAVALGINSQFSALVNPYVVNSDVRSDIYWMQQFRDPELFRDDLLTEYSRSIWPWGFIGAYRLTSVVIDPMMVSKSLPIILLAISSLYTFKLVSFMTSRYVGFLAALLFSITPTFLSSMVGGHARAFAWPLVIMFLYYLIRKRYRVASALLVIQSLFYPVAFVLSASTYAFTFIELRNKCLSVDRSISKAAAFVVAVLAGMMILYGQYFAPGHAVRGNLVNRAQVVNNPAFYEGGRVNILPPPSFTGAIVLNVLRGSFLLILSEKDPNILKILKIKPILVGVFIVSLAVALFLGTEIFKKRIRFPVELVFLLISSLFLYHAAYLLLLKLYEPGRYLQYGVRFVSFILCVVGFGQLLERIKSVRAKKVFQTVALVLVLLNFNVNKNVSLSDLSDRQGIYEYFRSLPKNIMIAGHPNTVSGIPAFSLRSVFITNKLSQPYFHRYWETIKKRTMDFFDAYYAEDSLSIYEFCEKNKIDYLVVDKNHFTEGYLMAKKFYFEPFNTEVLNLIRGRKDFALTRVPEKDKLFETDGIFIIKIKSKH